MHPHKPPSSRGDTAMFAELATRMGAVYITAIVVLFAVMQLIA